MVFTAIGAAAFAANEVYKVVKKVTKKEEKNGTSNWMPCLSLKLWKLWTGKIYFVTDKKYILKSQSQTIFTTMGEESSWNVNTTEWIL